MGFYLQLSCEKPSCEFIDRIGNATEFYVDANGVEHIYGHPVCLSAEAAQAGIAGYWRDLLCWNCGRSDRESIKLGQPVREPALAWSMFPPPSLENHPRLCPECGGILCDVSTLQMFLNYRQVPAAARQDVLGRLDLAKKHQAEHAEDEPDELFAAYFAELCERSGDPIERLIAEAANLATIRTEEEMILYRLDLVPKLPVSKESMAPLKDKYTSTCDAVERLRQDMFAKLDEEGRAAKHRHGGGPFLNRLLGKRTSTPSEQRPDWFTSPAMKAKRVLDSKIEELRTLMTHVWVARRLIEDEPRTLDMFRQRCPKCRAEPLKVDAHQT